MVFYLWVECLYKIRNYECVGYVVDSNLTSNVSSILYFKMYGCVFDIIWYIPSLQTLELRYYGLFIVILDVGVLILWSMLVKSLEWWNLSPSQSWGAAHDRDFINYDCEGRIMRSSELFSVVFFFSSIKDLSDLKKLRYCYEYNGLII